MIICDICDICDYCCFQDHIKTLKNMKEGHLIVFVFQYTLAVYFEKKLFQRDICDYCFFQVHIKILKKHEGGKPHSFSHNTH